MNSFMHIECGLLNLMLEIQDIYRVVPWCRVVGGFVVDNGVPACDRGQALYAVVSKSELEASQVDPPEPQLGNA